MFFWFSFLRGFFSYIRSNWLNSIRTLPLCLEDIGKLPNLVKYCVCFLSCFCFLDNSLLHLSLLEDSSLVVASRATSVLSKDYTSSLKNALGVHKRKQTQKPIAGRCNLKNISSATYHPQCNASILECVAELNKVKSKNSILIYLKRVVLDIIE